MGRGGFNRLKTVEALHLPSPLRDEAGGDPPAALPPPVGHGGIPQVHPKGSCKHYTPRTRLGDSTHHPRGGEMTGVGGAP